MWESDRGIRAGRSMSREQAGGKRATLAFVRCPQINFQCLSGLAFILTTQRLSLITICKATLIHFLNQSHRFVLLSLQLLQLLFICHLLVY